MAKRENRVKPMEHEARQLEMLKTLDPITTPEHLRPLSNALLDIAITAIHEASALEAGEALSSQRLQTLQQMVTNLVKS